jgi:hypothetical protein
MGRQYVDFSGQLIREAFKYDEKTDRYRIHRPWLDGFVDLLVADLERMKREEKRDG